MFAHRLHFCTFSNLVLLSCCAARCLTVTDGRRSLTTEAEDPSILHVFTTFTDPLEHGQIALDSLKTSIMIHVQPFLACKGVALCIPRDSPMHSLRMLHATRKENGGEKADQSKYSEPVSGRRCGQGTDLCHLPFEVQPAENPSMPSLLLQGMPRGHVDKIAREKEHYLPSV